MRSMSMAIVPLLAQGFTTPLLLWGTLLAAVPLVIHLMFRRQVRETPWAAMQFLVAATRRQSRWSKLDQWLLLAVRMLIPFMAALALAGPMFAVTLGRTSATPVQRILVLDVSLSTQAREDGRSRWSRIREAAEGIVARGKPGDTWQLLTIGSRGLGTPIAEPTFLSQPVLEELQQMLPTSQGGPLLEGTRGLVEHLAGAPDGRREIYFITDAQKSQWAPDAAEMRGQIQQAISELDEENRIVWVDVSEGPTANAAVSELTLADPYVLVGHPLRASATVRKFGNAPFPTTLEWRVDGRLVASQPLSGGTGDEVRRELRYVPVSAGDLRVEASIAADELTVDDRRSAVCVVRDSIRVLLVDGRPSGIPFENATDCLKVALAPEDDSGNSGRIEVTVIPDGRLLSENLALYDVVFLCDVPRFTDREGDLLASYTAAGGGLVLALGDEVSPESYHAALLTETRPLLPGRIGEQVGDAREREQAFLFAADDFQHPILAPFRGNPNSGFELTQTHAYRRLQQEPEAEVAVAFSNGDAAILERSFGRGRVLLIATALDRTWGTWPVWGHSFVPMMHQAVRYLSAGPLKSRVVEVGTPVYAMLPVGITAAEVQIRDPADRVWVDQANGKDGQNVVTIDDTTLPGFYSIERAGSGTSLMWFAVNPPANESDLTPLSATDLRSGLLNGIPFDTVADEEGAALSPSGTAAGSGADPVVSRWLLGLVLVLLIGEPFLAWNRRAGIMIAGSIVVFAVAGAWLGTTGLLGFAILFGSVSAWVLASRSMAS